MCVCPVVFYLRVPVVFGIRSVNLVIRHVVRTFSVVSLPRRMPILCRHLPIFVTSQGVANPPACACIQFLQNLSQFFPYVLFGRVFFSCSGRVLDVTVRLRFIWASQLFFGVSSANLHHAPYFDLWEDAELKDVLQWVQQGMQ